MTYFNVNKTELKRLKASSASAQSILWGGDPQKKRVLQKKRGHELLTAPSVEGRKCQDFAEVTH